MKLAMLACCAVMLVPTVGWFAAGRSVTSISQAFTAFLPLIGCLALHGAMFLFMGRSCHGSAKTDGDRPDVPEAAKVPVVGRSKGQAAPEVA